MSNKQNEARFQLFRGPGQAFEMSARPLPEDLSDGEVLVEISLATICGSDLHTVDGRRGAPTPCVLGHEGVGRVVSSRRRNLSPGQRVTWTLADSCCQCETCREYHLPQKCESLFKYGHASFSDGTGLNGCYSTHILLRSGTEILPVAENLADETVVPANCALATMVNAVSKLPRPCRSVLVQGGGLLGIYACALLKHLGVENIFCMDLSAQRLALAQEFGGTPVEPGNERVLRAAAPRGVDAVIEVAGSSSLVKEGLEALRPGGTYVWAGMVHPETQLNITGEDVVRKCATIHGVHNYSPEHLSRGLKFLEEMQHQLPFGKLVSPALPLKDLEEGLALSRKREWMRVAIRP